MEKQKRQKHNRPLAREVLRNTIYDNLGRLVSSIGGIIFSVAIARLLRPELFGVYGLTISILSFIMIFADLGFMSSITRWVAYALGKNNKKLARTYFRFLSKNALILLTIFSIGVFASSDLFAYFFSIPELSLSLKIMSIYFFLNGVFRIFSGLFTGLRNLKYLTGYWSIFNIVRLSLLPVFLILLNLSFIGAFLCVTFGTFFGVVYLLYFLIKKYSFVIFGKIKKLNKKTKSELNKFVFYTASLSITGIVFTQMDILMIGFFLGATQVGYYKVAQSIILTIIGFGSLAVVVFPIFSALSQNDFLTLFRKSFRISAIISFPLSFGLIWIAGPFVKVLYGHEYMTAVMPLSILSFMIIESITLSLFDTAFVAKGLPKISAEVRATSAVINIFLNYFLIQMFGIVGAAIATILSRYFNMITLGILAYKKFGVTVDHSSIIKPLVSSLLMFFILCSLPKPKNIFFGLIYIGLAGIVYFLALLLIRGIEKDDIELIKFKLFT